jgi:hypothetical protein
MALTRRLEEPSTASTGDIVRLCAASENQRPQSKKRARPYLHRPVPVSRSVPHGRERTWLHNEQSVREPCAQPRCGDDSAVPTPVPPVSCSDGESHFDTIEIAMALRDFAPPTTSILVSDAQPASHFVFAELPGEWNGTKPHPSANRQIWCACPVVSP